MTAALPRNLLKPLKERAGFYPVVVVTGPRQSGKTTLCRAAFPHLEYANLEAPDVREHACEDPRGFLRALARGAIIDEAQHVPELFSHIQVMVDEDDTPGRFVLTGSEHLSMSERVSQSLAGRCGILHLLPLSHSESLPFPHSVEDVFGALWTGGYPRILQHGIPPDIWLSDYVGNYLQRDVCSLLRITELDRFSTFLRLMAANTGQELNLSRLGADVGVSHATVASWISVLQASFIVFKLPARHPNVRKQWVKAPKVHFFDTGLACYLLRIRSSDELRLHPLRGAIFETWVASERYKAAVHRGVEPMLEHLRASRGVEIDIVDTSFPGPPWVLEAKSGETVAREAILKLRRAVELISDDFGARTPRPVLAYAGDASLHRSGVDILPWNSLDG